MPHKPFIIHTGMAAPMLRDNIDTDQIIPSREMKSVSKIGLGDGMFAGQRYTKPGGREPNPDFVLNQPAYKRATILLSGKNFGCGSSREHAVWALAEYGIRAVIAESFGQIFYNNCITNGIAAITLGAKDIAKLKAVNPVTIDLPSQTANDIPFFINKGDKDMLVGGLDAIGMTLSHADTIKTHIQKDHIARAWAY